MFSNLNDNDEPAWAGRFWYGSVFGAWCVLSASVVVGSALKHGTSRFFLGPWFLILFALALHSFIVAMKAFAPTKTLSRRVNLVTVLGTLPWILSRVFFGR